MRAVLFVLTCGAELCAQTPLALFTDFEHTPSAGALLAMRQEIARIFEPSGLQPEWHARHETEVLARLPRFVVISFRGACRPQTGLAELVDSDVTLASTEVNDGRVLPFTSVQCDEIRSLMPEAKEPALGIAMARVVAHEIYHVLLQTREHAALGIAKAAHTRRELTALELRFDAGSERRLRGLNRLESQPKP